VPLPPIASSATTVPSIKRRRTDTPDETSADSASSLPSRKPRDGPKKKKANRACYHCQKAHLTCDDCELYYSLLPIEGWCFFSDTNCFPHLFNQPGLVSGVSSAVSPTIARKGTAKRPNISSTMMNLVCLHYRSSL